MLACEINAAHLTRIYIAEQKSSDRSSFQFGTTWAFLVMYVRIPLALQRSKLLDVRFGIIESIIRRDSMQSRMRQSHLNVTGPVVDFSSE